MILADIQQLDANVAAEIGLVDQRFHAAPGRLDALEVWMVHDGIELATDLLVQRCNVLIEQCLVQTLDFM
ncbi:hypothetical protein D3C81_1872970 [compost metagenome]